MASRKLNTEGIDESLLLASIGKSRQIGDPSAREGTDTPAAYKPPESSAQPAEARAKPEPARKKRADYGSTFLRRSELKSRKCVYISAEAHDIVSKIVNTIADKEITVAVTSTRFWCVTSRKTRMKSTNCTVVTGTT